jgi:hypothetical protein
MGEVEPVPVARLGRLTRVEARTIWVSEARDFTPWLLANADYLAEALGIELELRGAEHPVGGFNLDLVGRDLTNNCVLIVENQLAGSDHVHLGQLVTYAAGTGAGTIVWISPAMREEHKQAIEWLNEHSDETVRFFGLEVEVVRIGESEPAATFKIVAQPNDWQRDVRTATTVINAGGKAASYQAFWSKLLQKLNSEHPDWTRARRPQLSSWMTMRRALRGTAQLNVSFTGGARIRTELYIDSGDAEENAQIFQNLLNRQIELESAFGRALAWERMPDRRAKRIADYRDGQVDREQEHASYIEWLVDSLGRWLNALNTGEGVAWAAPPS